MTMYELSDPTAEQILVADHDKGVRVRVLLDHDDSGGSVNQAAYSTLSAAGVAVAWANDSEIFHQKTITVDGSESAIMTGNLTPQYYATTRDFVVMDRQTADTQPSRRSSPPTGPGGTRRRGRRGETWCGVRDPNRRSSPSSAPRPTASCWRTRRWTQLPSKTLWKLTPDEE